MASVLAKGQLSYLILSCLIERDMYGLELIDEIKKRSGVEIKLPSLYSNLNRMKELKFISSYLKESTKGPKCSYSSITEIGRKELEKLKEGFGAQSFIVTENQEEKIDKSISKTNEESVSNNEILENSAKEDNAKLYDDYNDFFAAISDQNESDENNDEQIIEVQDDQNEEQFDLIKEANDAEEIYDENKISDIEKDTNDEILASNKEDKTEEKQDIVAIQEEENQDIDNNAIIKDDSNKEIKEKVRKNDAVFLSNDERSIENEAREYNQRIFDVSMDYNKNKKRKSFSENQIEMVVNDAIPAEQKREKDQENINNLKEALLQIRQGNYDNIVLNKQEEVSKVEEKQGFDEPAVASTSSTLQESENNAKEQAIDDGVFITDRVDYIPKSKRFEIPKFNFMVSDNSKPLPAPKRDANFDPNCSDIKAKIETLYSMTESKKEAKQDKEDDERNDSVDIDNYDDLKDYYETQNISFKVYKRADKKAVHNTNKLVFFVELLMFGLITLGSGLLYMTFSLIELTNPNTNFIYYLIPILYFIYLGIRLYMYKKVSSKVPRPLYNFIVVWGSAIILSLIVFCLNLAGGMVLNNPAPCITTLVLPIFLIVMIFIVRHYIMLFSLKRYWK